MAVTTEVRRTTDGVAYNITYNTISGQTEIKKINDYEIKNGAICYATKPVTMPYKETYIPKQIIQREDSKTTILIWGDNSKTIVQCSPDEDFVPEFGIAMATMNKIYGNRNQFKKYTEKKTFWQDKIKTKMEKK